MGKPVDIRRRGLVIAAWAGGGVLAVTIVQNILGSLVALLSGIAYSSSFGEYFGAITQSVLLGSLTTTLPFGIGVFLSLWQLAPIAPPLRFFHVLARSVLAAGVGAVAALIVGVAVGTISGLARVAGLTFVGPFFPGGEVVSSLVTSFAIAVQQSLGVFVSQVPLVVLAGLLVWLWARGRDRAVDLEGALDL